MTNMPAPAARKREPPIFPRDSAPFAALSITLAVMCYLACLAVGGLLLVERATATWSRGLSNEATVVIRPLANVDVDTQMEQAMAALQSEGGVTSVKPLSADETLRLLRPWLGQDLGSDLPLPRLIALTFDQQHQPDMAALEKDVAGVKGASLDTHQRWQDEFSRLGRNLALLAALVLGLLALATVALVAYAARAVMEANRNVVEVLELAGAEPRFISRANDRQFLATGLSAGLFGFFLSILTFLAIGLSAVPGTEALAASAGNLLWAKDSLLQTLAALILVPLAATLIAVWTARFTLLRLLERAA